MKIGFQLTCCVQLAKLALPKKKKKTPFAFTLYKDSQKNEYTRPVYPRPLRPLEESAAAFIGCLNFLEESASETSLEENTVFSRCPKAKKKKKQAPWKLKGRPLS